MQRAKVCIYTGSEWVNRGQGGMNARAAAGTRMVRDGLAWHLHALHALLRAVTGTF